MFNLRPKPTNDIQTFAVSERNLPHCRNGEYLHDEYVPEVSAFGKSLGPVLLISLSLWAVFVWAILGDSRISKIRGRLPSPRFGKVLPTYHPAAILRQWDLRHVTVLDLMKAKREAEFPEVRRPSQEIWLEPTLSEIQEFFETRTRTQLMLQLTSKLLVNKLRASVSLRALALPWSSHFGIHLEAGVTGQRVKMNVKHGDSFAAFFLHMF